MLNKLFIIGIIFLKTIGVHGQNSFESTWSAILQDHVSAGERDGVKLNLVDYKSLSKDARFFSVIDDLNNFNIESLNSQKEKLAFWINAYNIAAIKIVVDNYPVKSIRDIGGIFTSVWKKDAIKIGGENYSLHYIEHKILRKMNEPRIHFAIVCASISCPDILNSAYNANELENQLDTQVAAFLQNKKKGFRIDNDGTMYISSIFKWFKEDFGGEVGIRQFLQKYYQDDFSGDLKYMSYNWNLNITKGISH